VFALLFVGKRTSTGALSRSLKEDVRHMIAIIIAILLAALAYWVCLAIGLPAIVAIIAAILVLLSGIGTGGYGYGRRGI
jgi:heme/copper-type cytochrome/quinol oxidase subunit 4